MPPAPRAYARTLFALLAALVVAAPASAQQRYKEDPVDKTLRLKTTSAKNYIKSGGDAAAKKELQDFIEKYYLPSMTQWTASGPRDKDPLQELGRKRLRLFKDYIDAARGADHQLLTQQAFQFARRVFGSAAYHPAVRYNAILILGQLNERPVGADGNAAPLPAANNLLAAILSRGVTDPRRPRYEMAGALVGLERHAASLPRQQLAATVKALQTMLEADELAGQYADGVKDYLYIQAARTMATALNSVGSAGRGGAYAKAIGKRIADESLELETRAKIAAQLDRIGLKPNQFDASELALAVSDLAVAVAEQEKEFAVKFEDIMQRGGVSGRRGQVAGRDKFDSRTKTDDQNGETELVLDGMVSVLRDTRVAASALAPIADAAGAAAMTAIASAIDTAEKVALDDNSVDLDVTDAVKTMAAEINAAALTPPEPAAPAEEAAAAEDTADAPAEPAAEDAAE